MKNTGVIVDLCAQMKQAADSIERLSQGMELVEQFGGAVLEDYESLRLDELEHCQVLVLRLTEMLTQTPETSNADEGGSVFAEGELTDVKEPESEGAE